MTAGYAELCAKMQDYDLHQCTDELTQPRFSVTLMLTQRKKPPQFGAVFCN
jgi:hypothetical protein